MKVLILGARGMLGHRLAQGLADCGHEVSATLRGSLADLPTVLQRSDVRVFDRIDVDAFESIRSLLDALRPQFVLNCIGVVKQLASAKDPLVAIPINALLPHRLAGACSEIGARLIHFSTDCVFSGSAGPYSEASAPDPQDLYGRSKLLGEVNAAHVLTLRTSIIGHELDGGGSGLVAWILRNCGQRVAGYARALYTGVTTDFMADAVDRLIDMSPALCGVWHLGSDPISKYGLVGLVNEMYGLGMQIDRDEAFVCDRRLDSSLLRNRAGIMPPSWPEMITTMHANFIRQRGN